MHKHMGCMQSNRATWVGLGHLEWLTKADAKEESRNEDQCYIQVNKRPIWVPWSGVCQPCIRIY